MIVEAKFGLDLVQLVEKASSLSERLSGLFVPKGNFDDDALADIEVRLKRWCQSAARGDQANFEKRLVWDGMDIDTVRRVLGPVSFAEGQALPRWVMTLDEILGSLRSDPPPDGSPAPDRCLD